jgi:hypothetical protein
MLDIQCSEVKNGQVVISWKKTPTVDSIIEDQVKGKHLYILIRVKDSETAWHTIEDIEIEERFIWFQKPGMQDIDVFPFWSWKKIGYEEEYDLQKPRVFNKSEYSDRFCFIEKAFNRNQSLIKFPDQDISINDNLENPLDYILHKSFTRTVSVQDFSKEIWLDKFIRWAFKDVALIDQCERRLMTIPAILWTVLLFFIITPLVYLISTVAILFQILFGVRPRALAFGWFRFQFKDLNLDDRYHFGLSPFVFVCWGCIVGIFCAVFSIHLPASTPVLFFISGLTGFALTAANIWISKKTNVNKPVKPSNLPSADIYLRGKATMTLQNWLYRTYFKAKSSVCKPIIRK